MKINPLVLVLLVLTILTQSARSEPFHIIIVTMYDAEFERGYTEFLQNLYRGNVIIHIDPNRYVDNLNTLKKLELETADLIIISANNRAGSYNSDPDFWNELPTPILNHSIKLARSDEHSFWDWLKGSRTGPHSCTFLDIARPDDQIFAGIDTAAGIVQIFTTSKDIDHSDQGSAGYGKVVATFNGDVVIARWIGTEVSYYNGSYYAPDSPRIFFALPALTYEFFGYATADGKLMLKNAILSLLPINQPDGDLDDDLDVDFDDFAIFARQWRKSGCDIDDLQMLTENWLNGVDFTAPQPTIMTWEVEPLTTDTNSIQMVATLATDLINGVEYYFQCTSGNGPDSGWQYSNVFEPNTLIPGVKYTYRVKARDTSGNLNETDWSDPITARTFEMFRGISDASAAVAIDENHFIVADDEGNRLCIYDSRNNGSAPVAEPNIGPFLNLDPCQPEADIEGATWFNNKIFWITSHGRNKDGQYWYSRYQFFVTTVTKIGEQIQVTVNGNYTHLIDDLIAYDSIYKLGLAAAIGVEDGHIDPRQIPELAPKQKGLNIEGLSTTADGKAILIGFRNPQPEVEGVKKALIIKLNNPEAVVLSGAKPDFDPPILLDIEGFGIRSIEYSPSLGQYVVIAGSYKSENDEPLQMLYSYEMTTGLLTVIDYFSILTPEAIFQFPDTNDLYILSDDGTLLIQTPQGPVQNKLLPREQRTFRTQVVSP